jgi:hypothetical protein
VEKEDEQRLVAYVTKRDARKLKAKLALQGESFASWLRKTIKKFVEE